MKKLWTLLSVLVLVLAIPTVTACGAALATALSTASTIIQDASQALSIIDVAFDAYQSQHPVSAEDRVKFQALLATAYQDLNIGTRAVSDGKEVSQGQFDDAFKDFKVAYAALHDFLKAHGVTPVGAGLVGVGVAGGTDFQEPKIFSAKVQ